MTEIKSRSRGFTQAVILALALGGVSATVPAPAFADAGSYLATRQATIDRDLRALSQYATRFLVGDPTNPDLLEAAISGYISLGDFEAVKGYAIALEAAQPGNQIAAMATLTNLALEEKYADIVVALDAGQGVSPIVDTLLRAWALVGTGDMSAALDVFDQTGQIGQGFEFFGPYNKALAVAYVGDYEAGADILSKAGDIGTRTAVIARIQMLSQLERSDEALALMESAFGPKRDPEIEAYHAKLVAGEAIPFDVVRSARDGIADVFHSVAVALDGGLDDSYVLLYARVAQELRPEKEAYPLFVARLLEKMSNFDLATEAYETIPAESAFYPMAELGRAEALRAAGKGDAEIEVLKQLAKSRADNSEVHVVLGDVMRRNSRYEEAIAAYTDALALMESDDAAAWPLYFTRGIAYERSDQWPEAEADLRRALALQPGQAQVLNYLGYSFLERRENYDEAMQMIRAAVAARPDDGYITDSLGWGLYRIGKFEEAVEPMERAAELLPVDPIINDHLGDVYWAVGREREAMFQWHRAQSFDPEPEDAERIRRKIEVGLDRVLIEEGEAPTRTPNDG
ncbi:tetratricopeptide repeat protein [Celeribacter arenosi]|uniref:Tetratricopeptide repeat protein n=1 Tax=Celeribacter arenosi TaxID=792649 RepID=A0ABP7K0G6_9RHOB